MNPAALRTGLRVVMRAQHRLPRAEREGLAELIRLGIGALRVIEEEAAPVPETVPGDFRPTGLYARDFPATRRLPL